VHVRFYGHVRQYHNLKEEIDAAIHEVLESGQYVLGPTLARFEEELAEYCGMMTISSPPLLYVPPLARYNFIKPSCPRPPPGQESQRGLTSAAHGNLRDTSAVLKIEVGTSAKEVPMIKRAWRIYLLVILAWALSAFPAQADGIIIPKPPPHLPRIWPQLAIKYHHVQVDISDQVATTQVDQVFLNEADFPVEGMYVFPLPDGTTITRFDMWADGKRLEGSLLDRDEARRIYEQTVRRRKDPALLEYIGRGAFQARIFPIPPHGERRIQIEYQEVLPMDQGLVRYIYPLNTEKFSARPLEEVVISVELESSAPLRAIYSPSHPVAVDRVDDHHARIGYEDRHVKPDTDFTLYYSVAQKEVGLNLLSYRSPGDDGFFLLLIAPRLEVRDEEAVAKDVICVLDTSGSMKGEKLAQAKDALGFVLDHLNPGDRFNFVAFSTGVRSYAPLLHPASEAQQAKAFVAQLQAMGGTDINRALLEALSYAGRERPTILIFLTDGLPTEGVTDAETILQNVEEVASDNVRIFSFGVGDDVNTLLLDRLAEAHRGAASYVRPGQAIDEEVSTFYAKVNTPVLTDLRLKFDSLMVEDIYPYPLPDLFAGAQLIVVGRYRDGGLTGVTLEGRVNGEPHRLSYKGLRLHQEGGEPFVARLWATRKIGHLLTQIRLHGESQELVDEVVALSIRYGLITPYTSFLVEEPEAALTDNGRREIVRREMTKLVREATAVSGAEAVSRAQAQRTLKIAEAPLRARQADVRIVGDRAFVLRNGVWTDTIYDPSWMKALHVVFGSEEYFRLLVQHPDWGRYFALGPEVITVLREQAYVVTDKGHDMSQVRPFTPTSSPPAEPARPLSMPGQAEPLRPWGLLVRSIHSWLDGLFGQEPSSKDGQGYRVR